MFVKVKIVVKSAMPYIIKHENNYGKENHSTSMRFEKINKKKKRIKI